MKKHLRLIDSGNTVGDKRTTYNVYPTAFHFQLAASIMANSWDEFLESDQQDKEDEDKANCLVNFAEQIGFSLWLSYDEEETPREILEAMKAQGIIPTVVKKPTPDDEEE